MMKTFRCWAIKALPLLILGVALLMSTQAKAGTATLSWEWPTQYCDGTTLDPADIAAAEVYIDVVTIPSVTDGGDACAEPVDQPPIGTVMQTVTTSATTVDIDLSGGQNYFFRMRVQVNGLWSNLSGEATKFVDFVKPNVPISIIVN